MSGKRHRCLVDYDDDDEDDNDGHDLNQPYQASPPPRKRARAATCTGASSLQASQPPPTQADRISRLSDELLLRILSFLKLPGLLTAAPVSRRFARLAADSQLWKAHYYERFVLPRALRIPGFRETKGFRRRVEREHRLHYAGRRKLWAERRKGSHMPDKTEGDVAPQVVGDDGERVDWKMQYKLRHNWSRGKCAVEELKMEMDDEASEDAEGRRMLVKVVEGVAVTADAKSGLRAWDLKTKDLLAQVNLGSDEGKAAPTCVAVDDHHFHRRQTLDIALGFLDGSFGVWNLDIRTAKFEQKYWHRKSSNGALVGMSYSHPYLLTATDSVLISLYTFDGPLLQSDGDGSEGAAAKAAHPKHTVSREIRVQKDEAKAPEEKEKAHHSGEKLRPAYLLTSLRSHTSRTPLALSIRKTAATTIASIAYTFSTRQGWSIGIQDLHIRAAATKLGATPEVTTTRLAYTPPMASGRRRQPGSPPSTPPSSRSLLLSSPAPSSPATPGPTPDDEPGPTSLCYTHPYLLATLPDNTLVLHLCTSNAETLSVSPGIRLWGHTSGISDAEITARGKAVSVSSRGDEMRVWELEGRPPIAGTSRAAFGSRSVQVRPSAAAGGVDVDGVAGPDWDERRNWVGFDDEMVIVLKESREGRESLMVYDFT